MECLGIKVEIRRTSEEHSFKVPFRIHWLLIIKPPHVERLFKLKLGLFINQKSYGYPWNLGVRNIKD